MGMWIGEQWYPDETNVLAKMYQHIKEKDVLFMQRWLWDFVDADTRAERAREMVIAAAEVLSESGS